MSDPNENKKSPYSEATAIYVRPAPPPPPDLESNDTGEAHGTFDAKTVVMSTKTAVTQAQRPQPATVKIAAVTSPSTTTSISTSTVTPAKLPATAAEDVRTESQRDIRIRPSSVTMLTKAAELTQKARRAFRDSPNMTKGLIAFAIVAVCVIGVKALKRNLTEASLESSRAALSKSSAEISKAESPSDLASESAPPNRPSVIAVQTTGDVLEDFDRAAAKTQTQASEYSRSGSNF